MQDIELYRQFLGIESPWIVDCVSLSIEETAVYVYLVEAPNTTWRCSTCGGPATLYDHREESEWRHLDSSRAFCKKLLEFSNCRHLSPERAYERDR